MLADVAPGTRLWLVRHGETSWNHDGRVQGHLDISLSERGEAQARRLARWLADEPLTAVYSSDLERARRTAEIMAEGRLPVWPDARYRESRFGAFEGLTGAEAEARYPEAYHAWRRDAVRHRPPGGETLEDLRARCLEALAEHLPRHPRGTVVVVAHGGPIRAMLCGVLELPLEAYPRLTVENTSVARITFRERGAILAGMNDTCHLRAEREAADASDWEEK